MKEIIGLVGFLVLMASRVLGNCISLYIMLWILYK